MEDAWHPLHGVPLAPLGGRGNGVDVQAKDALP